MAHDLNRDGKKKKLFRVSPSYKKASHLIEELRRRLSNSEEWALRFQNLYKAIMPASSESSPLAKVQKTADLDIDCETCESLLVRYVIDEFEGHDPKVKYPLMWDHLQACDHCQQSYDALTGLLPLEI